MIVIDASVATKLINTQEENSELARQLLVSHLDKKEEIIVPSLLFLEVANVLATKTSLAVEEMQKGIALLYAVGFLVYDFTEEDLHEAGRLAKRYATSVYDMLYAVVAKKKIVDLITCDRRFVERVNFSFVRRLNDN